MLKNYILSRLPAPGIEAAVLATGAINPLDELGRIERDLKRKKVAGKVVFDLLLAHGNKVNRYFVGEFDGEHFKSTRLQSGAGEYDVLSAASARILQKHLSEVDPSLLSKAMQFALREGIAF